MTPRSRTWIVALLIGCAVSGCSNGNRTSGRVLSERQRDSVIARSSLPGASTVGRALQESDKASVRAASLDSLAN
jgi:hypothetical protein